MLWSSEMAVRSEARGAGAAISTAAGQGLTLASFAVVTAVGIAGDSFKPTVWRLSKIALLALASAALVARNGSRHRQRSPVRLRASSYLQPRLGDHSGTGLGIETADGNTVMGHAPQRADRLLIRP